MAPLPVDRPVMGPSSETLYKTARCGETALATAFGLTAVHPFRPVDSDARRRERRQLRRDQRRGRGAAVRASAVAPGRAAAARAGARSGFRLIAGGSQAKKVRLRRLS